jgi:hypothetical protein
MDRAALLTFLAHGVPLGLGRGVRAEKAGAMQFTRMPCAA